MRDRSCSPEQPLTSTHPGRCFPTILNTETYDYKTALTATVSNTGLPATTNGPPPAICPIPKSVTPAVVSTRFSFVSSGLCLSTIRRVILTKTPPIHPPASPVDDGAMEERKEPDKTLPDKTLPDKKSTSSLQTKYRLKASSSRNDNCRDVREMSRA
ncbi:hypothetical protein BV898_12957 [Hypsibius exemplaris]|uniref:Uncharacterized protein n=1 Tax=Hypsibius exemplaris TaxID=2072580 RepID=A0A1W0WCD0_HYPEX|nr:hypothetical protein BV898_12957 [Hypsibius exemplaris]